MSKLSVELIIEGLLFAADRPLSVSDIIHILNEDNNLVDQQEIITALNKVENQYQDRACELKKTASGYRFQIKQNLADYIEKLWQDKPQKYTRALLETLALIAYKQPITRGEIEDIRGVSVSTSIIRTLQERKWINVVGYREVPGRPSLYATTSNFLDYFNLEHLGQLPPLAKIRELHAVAANSGLALEDDLDQVDSELNKALNELKPMDQALLNKSREQLFSDIDAMQHGIKEDFTDLNDDQTKT